MASEGAMHAARLLLRVAYSPDQPRDDQGQWTAGSGASTTMAQLNEKFPHAPQVIDGRAVLKDVPNTSSISGISDSYEELPGVREVQMSEFDPVYTGRSYSVSENRRIDELADEIRASNELKPLIVVVDHEKYPYILEGGHRFDALIRLKAKSFPAVIVVDTSLREIRGLSALRIARRQHVLVDAADALAPTFSVAVRAAFALGRQALPDVDAAVKAVARALAKVAPGLLAQALEKGGQVTVSRLEMRAAYDPDQPRDEQGQWTDSGTNLSDVDNAIDALPQADATGEAAGFVDNKDSVRNPLLPKFVDADEDAITDYVAERYGPVAQEIFDAGLGSPGDIRSIPISRIDTQQATLSKQKLKEYIRIPKRNDEDGIAVRYGRNFILIDGNHRVVAAKLRGEKNVRLRVVSDTPKIRGAAAKKPLAFRFDAAAPRVTSWARKHAAELVKGIADVTRDRLRAIVAKHAGGEVSDADYSKALGYAVGDEERAEVIARTESMIAVHQGQREAWSQAVDSGLLDEDAKRVWIVTADDRLCPICEPLDGETAALDGRFDGEFDGPPAHPNCRCTEGLQ